MGGLHSLEPLKKCSKKQLGTSSYSLYTEVFDNLLSTKLFKMTVFSAWSAVYPRTKALGFLIIGLGTVLNIGKIFVGRPRI